MQRFKNTGAWAASVAQHLPMRPVPPPPVLTRSATLADLSGWRPAHSKEERKYTAPANSRKTLLVRSALRFFDPLFKLYSIFSTAISSNWWHLGMAGKLPAFLCPPECIDQQDFAGFDYYWGISTLQLHRIQQLLASTHGDYDQAPVWPAVLYGMLTYHAKLFPQKEILLIENGCVETADGLDRASYIERQAHQVQRAHRKGIKVAGYLCWSITSNQEPYVQAILP